jgi:ribosomal protein S18
LFAFKNTFNHIKNIMDKEITEEITSIDQATPQELTEIITELEKYRDRLVSDTLAMAQRAKVMKAQAMANLEPSLAQIDAQLQELRQKQASLSSGS